jgi:hypothetical protein
LISIVTSRTLSPFWSTIQAGPCSAPVMHEDALLAELERVDCRVLAVPVAAPGAQQPGDRRAVRVLLGDVERKGAAVRFEELQTTTSAA